MFSIIYPMDTNRLEQFKETKLVYDAMPQKKEFVIATRSHDAVSEYIRKNKLGKGVKLVPYEWNDGFNPALGLNLALKNAKYNQIIVTSPEVRPDEDALAQLSELAGQNVICQVFDQGAEGNLATLVCEGYRSRTPALYFLAMFNKADIEAINGWDEDFMLGYAYEDDDFGSRWVTAGLPFTVKDEIQGVHLYHPRGETIQGGTDANKRKYEWNRENGIIRPANGLIKDA